MTVVMDFITIDARDHRALARWWGDVLGYDVDETEADETQLFARDGSKRRFSFVPTPDTKTTKNRVHLDLRPDDQAAEVARLEAKGAKRVDIGQGPEVTWVVMADPEGNEFCILRALSDDERGVVRWGD